MKSNTWTCFTILPFLLFAITSSKAQEELSKIHFDDLLEMKLDESFHYTYATFKNEDGELLSEYERQQLNQGKMAMEYYADKEGIVREVRIRPHTLEDKFEQAVLKSQTYLLLDAQYLNPVECDQKEIFADLVKEVENIEEYRASLQDIEDLDFRELWGMVEEYKDSIDHNKRVFSYLYTCEWTDDNLDAITKLVRGRSYVAGFHYYKLRALYEEGKIKPETWAGIMDNILLEHGFAQIYGTNIRNGRLATLESPYNVNTRRMEMGLGPIEPELDERGLDFDIEVHRMTRNN